MLQKGRQPLPSRQSDKGSRQEDTRNRPWVGEPLFLPPFLRPLLAGATSHGYHASLHDLVLPVPYKDIRLCLGFFGAYLMTPHNRAVDLVLGGDLSPLGLRDGIFGLRIVDAVSRRGASHFSARSSCSVYVAKGENDEESTLDPGPGLDLRGRGGCRGGGCRIGSGAATVARPTALDRAVGTGDVDPADGGIAGRDARPRRGETEEKGVPRPASCLLQSGGRQGAA